MSKIDFKQKLKSLYAPSAKEISFVGVPMMNFVMIDGVGDPNGSPEFQAAAEALFAISYGIKFVIKKFDDAMDYTVMPLEGLWWADDMTAFPMNRRDEWKWTLMVMQPDFIQADVAAESMRQTAIKKKLPAIEKARFDSYSEGAAFQIMHIGPYSDTPKTISTLNDHIKNSGYRFHGKHHEIYLNDPRKTAPEKLKTVLRQPVSKD